jgi:hypothetical protein
MKKHIAEELPARKFKQADMDASKKEDGGKEGKGPEERVRQAVYDIRYRSRREEIPLAQAFAQYMQNSNMSAPEKAAVKAKLAGKEMKEEYGISELASDSIANALYRVFVEDSTSEESSEDELLSFYREEVIKNSRGETKYKVEVMGTDGRSYVRYATRDKINELRANPNIKSVEMTDYGEPYEGERSKGQQTAAAKAGKDYDGDGKKESSSKEHAGVVHNAIQRKKGGIPDGQDTRKESVEFIDEVKKVKKKNNGDKKLEKLDVMTGKNTVKVGPTDGQSIMAGYEYSSPVLTENDVTLGQLKFSKMLQEMAVSQNQQELAAMAIKYLDGNMPDASEAVKNMAKMGRKELKKFARTSHKGLPEKVEEAKCETSDSEDEDTRDEYAKKNVIKNRLRAALGVKNPIVISASNEIEGEQIDEIAPLVGGLALGGAALGAKVLSDVMTKYRNKVTGKAPSATTGKPDTSLSGRRKDYNDAIKKVLNQSYEPEGEQIDELRKSEKLGFGSPDTSRNFIPRETRKERGGRGGRHFWSGGQGGSRTERGTKKNEPDSQHQRLNPPEEKGRQLKRGRNAARQRWHSARD